MESAGVVDSTLPAAQKVCPESVTEYDIIQFRRNLHKVHLTLDKSKAKWKRPIIKDFHRFCSLNMFDSILILSEMKNESSEVATQTESPSEPKPSIEYDRDLTYSKVIQSLKHRMASNTRSMNSRLASLEGYDIVVEKNTASEDEEYESREENLTVQLEQQSEKIQEQEKMLKRLIRENEEMCSRLDESGDGDVIDHVTEDGVRLADEYSRVCDNEWMAAKHALNEQCTAMEEQEKIQHLHSIFQVVEEKTNNLMDDITLEIKHLIGQLLDPTLLQRKESALSKEFQKKELHSPQQHDKMPPNEEPEPEEEMELVEGFHMDKSRIMNAFGNYMKNSFHVTNLKGLKKVIYEALREKLLKEFPTTPEVKKSKTRRSLRKQRESLLEILEVRWFVDKVVALVWKMVVQRPRVEFKFNDMYKGESSYDLLCGDQCGLYEVYPLLYQGQTLLMKGKVYVKELKRKAHQSPPVPGHCRRVTKSKTDSSLEGTRSRQAQPAYHDCASESNVQNRALSFTNFVEDTY